MATRPTRLHLDARRTRRCVSQKVGFATYDEALTAAERMMDQGKVNAGCHITPYQCDQCNEWHVRNKIIVLIGRRPR